MNFLKGNLGWYLASIFLLRGVRAWSSALYLQSCEKSIVWFFPLELGGSLVVPIRLVLDFRALFFAGTVRLVTARVLAFSQFYIEGEKFKVRFIILVVLFVLSMLLLIFRGDLLVILVGWDGLGLTSYLLVLYFRRKKSRSAALLTALTNRIGDVGIMLFIGFGVLYRNFSPAHSGSLGSRIPWIGLLLVRAVTKSAQLPFSSWLPAAMAAPTPVSSLVHSSTLVTAGVYLVYRFYFCFLARETLPFLALISGVTLLVSSFTAVFESDLKKIIALSTLSQLALIFLIMSLGQKIISFLHLNTHAFFKSLLFMVRGDIIHSLLGWQDLRKAGAVDPQKIGQLAVCFAANSSLMGLPFMRGFSSKDLFLELSLSSLGRFPFLVLLYFSLLLTFLYTARFIALVLFSSHLKLLFSSQYLLFRYPVYTTALTILRALGGSSLVWQVFSFDAYIFITVPMKELALGVILIRVGTLYTSRWALRDSSFLLSSSILSLINLPYFLGPLALTTLESLPLKQRALSEGLGLFYAGAVERPLLLSFSWASQEALLKRIMFLSTALSLALLRLA